LSLSSNLYNEKQYVKVTPPPYMLHALRYWRHKTPRRIKFQNVRSATSTPPFVSISGKYLRARTNSQLLDYLRSGVQRQVYCAELRECTNMKLKQKKWRGCKVLHVRHEGLSLTITN
jgi:hypothetical protein